MKKGKPFKWTKKKLKAVFDSIPKKVWVDAYIKILKAVNEKRKNIK
jgi:hypothetical protein